MTVEPPIAMRVPPSFTNCRSCGTVCASVTCPSQPRNLGGTRCGSGLPKPQRVPPKFRGWLGQVTLAQTVPQLRQFVNDGGTLIAIGSSTVIGRHLGLPVLNHLVQDGKPLPRTKFYVPGSVLQVRVDTTPPLAWGMPDRVDVFFEESPAFDLGASAAAQGVRPVAWFDSDRPLRSGWAWGQQYLKDAVALTEASPAHPATHLFLFCPEILNRGQPHGP